MNVTRVNASDRVHVERCAVLMASSEPWITLKRSFDSALSTLGDPGKELHAVLANDDIAAFVLLDMRGPLAGYIQSLCVRPDQRGRGLGAALVGWAEQRIFRDSPNVFLCVSTFNRGAQRLYERLGYEVVGRFAGFIDRDHDELLLRKTQGPWAEFRTASPTKPAYLARGGT
jgi:[ribosomal protein S18]-alanine N-acetyltransferase